MKKAFIIIILYLIFAIGGCTSSDSLNINESCNNNDIKETTSTNFILTNDDLEKRHDYQLSHSDIDELISNLEWGNNLNSDGGFVLLDSIIDINELDSLFIQKRYCGFLNNNKLINDNHHIASYIYLLDLPYTNILVDNQQFFELYEERLYGDYDNEVFLMQPYANDAIIPLDIKVYGSGYVVVSIVNKTNVTPYYSQTYISLLPLDYSNFRKKFFGLALDVNGDQTGMKHYNLEDAYELGIISYENLTIIHDIFVKKIEFDEVINENVKNKIIDKLYLTYSSTMYVNKDDFKIKKYYGKYGDAYAVIYDGPWEHAQIQVKDKIGGIIFEYTNPFIGIWCE
ncbi:MAG: hypothetical protein J5691_04115 [Bacilli bacterium]|nr:hypothetical protein [Bacilli bacterium]